MEMVMSRDALFLEDSRVFVDFTKRRHLTVFRDSPVEFASSNPVCVLLVLTLVSYLCWSPKLT